MLQVYLDPCTVNSRKVLAGLDLLGTPYELNHVDYFTGAHKKPEFLAINPNGAVPAAVDGDFALSESNAILQYAADLSGSDLHYPKDLKRRADVNRWLLWETSTWFPSCYTFLVEYVVKPLLNTQPDEAIIAKETPNWHRLASILDARLAQSDWLVGDDVTIADIAVAAPMHVHRLQRLPLSEHPNLERWMADIEELPCWQSTQGAVDRALQLK
jgi:glutathione S-transferase